MALAVYALLHAGTFLVAEDPIQKADAIAVLAGTTLNRPLEAVDLYAEGYAPTIVLTQGEPEAAFAEAARRGAPLPPIADVTRGVMVTLGVPASAIVVMPRIHGNTAQEGQTLRGLALERRWKRLIVVTSGYHLRRAGFALRRELEGTNIDVMMRGTRYEHNVPERWWTSRGDVRWVLAESAKLIAYRLGLGA